ncbi:hypothetical protein [Carnobacterium divergens]|uniref:hypothetical protein n=1 Tax=Carnobacterium divergens TaxID=2748 RepID=UPI0028921342|nr:hypothetical protein [Carnobacterium divergens]MDT2010811.1 hypothetical protein [Carnobacterium divergens]
MNEDEFVCLYLENVEAFLKEKNAYLRPKELISHLMIEEKNGLREYQQYVEDNREAPSIVYIANLIENYIDRYEELEKEKEDVDFISYSDFLEKYDDLVTAFLIKKPIFVDEQRFIVDRECYLAGKFYIEEEEKGRKEGYSENFFSNLLLKRYLDFEQIQYPNFYKSYERKLEI